MKYRDIMGYSNKQPKKKVVKEIKKPTVVDAIKEEFSLNEGPAYEYSRYVDKIKKSEKQLEKSVMQFKKVLLKKGLGDEGKTLSWLYMSLVGKGRKAFMDKFETMMRKLV